MNAWLESAVRNFLERKGFLSESDNSYFKNLPFVTVGVCVKNSERTIGECLKSVVNSDYDKLRLEIIVVDGKSVDNTLSIARDILEKSGIVFEIFSDEGRGLGYGRQMVVDNAKGDYICWVDADSVVFSDFIMNGVKSLENDTKVGVAIPLTLFTGGNIIARLQGYAWLLPTLNAAVKGKTPNLAMNGAITPTKVLLDVGGFNTSIKGAGEDIELFYRMKIKGYKIAINPRAQLYHSIERSWKDLFRRASWWATGWPPKSMKTLIYKELRQQLLFIKLTIDVIRYFKDPAGLLMPFYGITWNTWYTISALWC
jgi:glycosyltransferase involved in cell wall biosynthesis